MGAPVVHHLAAVVAKRRARRGVQGRNQANHAGIEGMVARPYSGVAGAISLEQGGRTLAAV